ncbi:MAG TPA: glucose-6-phosphate dehydrogenase assembly protein OpcA [Candidatus Corynebacterium gallistercoris]|uniref:Glucose-6-phosphate dehydrogenase assembly protein OpcA n=1 Tax=Candidatus Corynebacterium gallistercoris TaxID=2838530 RepID=A0A9D1RZI5_9CORY|nr:glucose-6-phosphate dehydrogenase assembly protein OpcA [Candidatus Corynebacterium gallistercoris]
MIIDLPNTTTHLISRRLRELREERGEIATGRVLTFIVVATDEDDLPRIIDATHEASREHPARVLVVVTHRTSNEVRLDAEVRLGGDAGASEIIVMHLHGELSAHRASVVTPLLLPDTPIVAWWPTNGPRNPSADPIGALATRRITDSLYDADTDALFRRRMTYTQGDSDLAWARITLWRGLLASALDQTPCENIESVEITGPECDPSTDIAAGWLAERLQVPVTRRSSETGSVPRDEQGNKTIPIVKAELHRSNGDITVEVVDAETVQLTVDGKEALVTLGRRPLEDCLAEELRHLDPDYAFGHALRGLVRVNRPGRGGRWSQYRTGNGGDGNNGVDRWSSRYNVDEYNVQESMR